MTTEKPAMPPGFGERKGPANRSAIGATALVSAVVAAMVSAVVAFGVGRAWGPKPEASLAAQPGADPSRLGVLEEKQAKLDARLREVESRLPSSSSTSLEPEPVEKAMEMLEARMAEGNATSEELRMLRAICRQRGDTACADRVSERMREADGGTFPTDGGTSFNRAAAVRALQAAAKQAKACSRHEGRKVRTRVTVTFEPSGEVSVVEIGREEPHNEDARACLLSVFRKASTPPFEGRPMKVAKTVELDGPGPEQPKSRDLEF